MWGTPESNYIFAPVKPFVVQYKCLALISILLTITTSLFNQAMLSPELQVPKYYQPVSAVSNIVV